jgi:hypothetical protein
VSLLAFLCYYVHFYSCRIKETLRKTYADLANDFEHRLHLISSELAAIDGPLEVCLQSIRLMCGGVLTRLSQEQQQLVEQIQTRLPALGDALQVVANAEDDCSAANVEENDYTVFTTQDLEFELELLVHSIHKKFTFIENQVGSATLCIFNILTQSC